jgi:mannose-6-phosphate isomerase-like protein (cupin superfamily)
MYIKNKENAESKENPFKADVRVLFANTKTEVLHLKLEPQKMLSSVKINQDACFYILEGCAEVIIDNEKQDIDSDSFIFCPAGSEHCINNPHTKTTRILVIKYL